MFLKNISNLLNAKYVVSVGSGTDALMLSLKAAGVTPGSVTTFNFMQLLGQLLPWEQPIYVDIKNDFNIDPKKLKKITKKTKAILPVHWSVEDMKSLIKISNKYKIPIKEDVFTQLQQKKKCSCR